MWGRESRGWKRGHGREKNGEYRGNWQSCVEGEWPRCAIGDGKKIKLRDDDDERRRGVWWNIDQDSRRKCECASRGRVTQYRVEGYCGEERQPQDMTCLNDCQIRECSACRFVAKCKRVLAFAVAHT